MIPLRCFCIKKEPFGLETKTPQQAKETSRQPMLWSPWLTARYKSLMKGLNHFILRNWWLDAQNLWTPSNQSNKRTLCNLNGTLGQLYTNQMEDQSTWRLLTTGFYDMLRETVLSSRIRPKSNLTYSSKRMNMKIGSLSLARTRAKQPLIAKKCYWVLVFTLPFSWNVCFMIVLLTKMTTLSRNMLPLTSKSAVAKKQQNFINHSLTITISSKETEPWTNSIVVMVSGTMGGTISRAKASPSSWKLERWQINQLARRSLMTLVIHQLIHQIGESQLSKGSFAKGCNI